MRRSVGRSFNCITVDGDTSTSDTLLAFATGKAGHPTVTRPDDPLLRDFRRQLDALCIDLATLVVRDGEGAEKFVTIHVTGAVSMAALLGTLAGDDTIQVIPTSIKGTRRLRDAIDRLFRMEGEARGRKVRRR